MKKLDTIRIELKVNGESKIIWVTLGNDVDFDLFKYSIDKTFDEVEERERE